MDGPSSTEIIYRIDESDRISFVNPEWSTFAIENEAVNLAPENVLGRPFLSFISGSSTKQLFFLILAHVRQSQRSIEFPFRCDSPTLRRFMELTITPLDQRQLEFRCRIIKEESRNQVPLSQKTRPRTEFLLRMCSWCKRVALPSGEWVELEEALKEIHLFVDQPFPQVTHGICMDCELEVRAKLKLSPPKT